MIALRFKSFAGSVYLLVLLLLLPARPHSFFFLAGAAGNSTREDKMCDGLSFERQKQVQKTEKQNKRASKNVSIE